MLVSLSDYANELEDALRRKLPYTQFNKDINHATVVVCLAVKYAEKRVRLLTNKLDAVLYASPWFLEVAETFLARKATRLDVLIEDSTAVGREHPAIMLFDKWANARVRQVPESVVNGHSFNFMLVDDTGVRFERNRAHHEALVEFHADPGFVGSLVEFFDSVMRHAKPLPQ